MESPTSGNWSVGSNWLDGAPPPAAGSATLTLRFAPTGGNFTTSTHDLQNGFLANRLLFADRGERSFTIAAAPQRTITLTGASSGLTQAGAGPSRSPRRSC